MLLTLLPVLLLLMAAAAATAGCPPPAVTLGNMVLRDGGFAQLQGHRVAVLTNPTGVFVDTMDHLVDVMFADDTVDLVAVLGPEHGFRGDKQAETGDPLLYVDEATQLPVFSAYNMTSPELSAVLVKLNITTVVVDMQDVGVRLYTFIWTMYDVMAAAKLALEAPSHHATALLVLDRPNPLGGLEVGGPLLHEKQRSGYGKYPITHIHGMTIGELALLFNEAIQLPTTTSSSVSSSLLQVISMTGWRRDMSWEETGLPWVPPSPNLPTLTAARVYGATVFLEATTVSEGRGTTTPFELFGAPFLSAQSLAARLNADFNPTTRHTSSSSSPMAAFRAAYYIPSFSKYNGSTVPGVQWLSERTSSSAPPSMDGNHVFLSGTKILCAVRDLATPPQDFYYDGVWFGHPGTELIDQYAGTARYRQLLSDPTLEAEQIVQVFAEDEEAFAETRKAFLLY